MAPNTEVTFYACARKQSHHEVVTEKSVSAVCPGQVQPPGQVHSPNSDCSGRYASYWIAFLFDRIFAENEK